MRQLLRPVWLQRAAVLSLAAVAACGDAPVSAPLVASRIQAVSSATVIEPVGTTATVVVRSATPTGEPVAGVAITFEPSVTTGLGGAVPARTDARGEARVQWELGPKSGDVSLLVRSPGIEPITIRGVLLPGPAVRLSLDATPSSVRLSSTISQTPPVRVVDRFGNGVPGREVTFSVARGGGTVGRPVAYSDFKGDARAKDWGTGQIGYDQDLLATLVPDAGGATDSLLVPVRGQMVWTPAVKVYDAGSYYFLTKPALDASIEPGTPAWTTLGLDVPSLTVSCSSLSNYRPFFAVGSVGRMVQFGPPPVWLDDVLEPVFDPPTVQNIRALVRASRLRIRFTPYQKAMVVEATFELGDLRDQLRREFPAACLSQLEL